MDNLEILLDVKKQVKIKDKTIEIGAIGFKDLTVTLPRFLQKIIHKFDNVKWGENNIADLLIILQTLSEEEAAELISILVKFDDKEFIIKEILSSVKILQKLFEIIYNENKEVFSNFFKATGISLNKLIKKGEEIMMAQTISKAKQSESTSQSQQ